MKTLGAPVRLVVALVTFALTALPFRADATVMLPLGLEQLSQRADRVVLGVVESQRAAWSSNKEAIYTDVQLRVTRAYKGDVKVGDVVTVRREGGVVDGIGMRVFGAAVFDDGEEVVVFIEKRGMASYVVGMAQGRLPVALDARGVKTIQPAVSEISFTKEAKRIVRQPLAEFERELGRVMAAKKPERAR